MSYSLDRETGQPRSESHGAGLPILCVVGTAAVRGRVEASILTVHLRGGVRDMRRSARMLPTAAERTAMILDVALLCVFFHTMKRGFELSLAVASQVLHMTRGEGL